MASHIDVLIHPPTFNATATPSNVAAAMTAPTPGLSASSVVSPSRLSIVCAVPTPAIPGSFGAKPADASNTGYVNEPSYPGSLTTVSTGSFTAASSTTYSYKSFDCTTTAVSIPAGTHDVTFVGCRFFGTKPDNTVVSVGSACVNVTFSYCTFEPNLTYTPGIGDTMAGSTQIQYCVGFSNGTPVKGLLIDHCNMWGFGNAIDGYTRGVGTDYTSGAVITYNWIHDSCTDPVQGDHNDGVGYVDGDSNGWSNATIAYNTIASNGNTQGIAFQGTFGAGSGAYQHVWIHHNYLSGWGLMANLGENAGDMKFQNNTITDEFPVRVGVYYRNPAGTDPMLDNYAANGNNWSGNKFHHVTGGWGSAGDEGKFVLPTGTPTGSNPITGMGTTVSTSDF